MDERAPVLVGVGTASQALDEPGAGLDAIGLMAAAATAAAEDAGAPGLLGAVERIAVPAGTWSYGDPARLVAGAIGAAHATTVLAEVGVPQQTLVSDALAAIVAGDLDVALVVGGEAKRRASLAARAGTPVDESGPGEPDVRLAPTGELVAPAEIAARAWEPVQQYALVENARRAGEGLPIGEHLDDIASLWAGFNAVAAGNPAAAFGEPRDARFLRSPGPDNRPLAFPYAKWHSTQWSVDQAGALLLCSAGAARAHGVPRDRWVFPLVALESSYALSLSRRAELHRWPAMAALGKAARDHLGTGVDGIDLVELYSCFPAAVRVQQHELGIDRSRAPTVTGGMAFAGGPFNNFTYQATAALVPKLREAGGLALVSTVSGLLTKPGLMVWSTEPGDLLVADLGEAAALATREVPVVDAHRGAARVASYTVTYDGHDPARLVVIADTAGGERCVATADDPDLAAIGTQEELIGCTVDVDGTTVVGVRR